METESGKEVNEMADEIEETSQQAISFGIIATAGQGRSLAFEALKAAKEGDFDKAYDLLKQSQETGVKAHDEQMSLLTKEASGEHVPVDIFLVHAQDHLMTSMLAQELIKEIVDLRKEIAEGK